LAYPLEKSFLVLSFILHHRNFLVRQAVEPIDDLVDQLTTGGGVVEDVVVESGMLAVDTYTASISV
jgi:hypothetical protein